jgi:hypothetical protein
MFANPNLGVGGLIAGALLNYGEAPHQDQLDALQAWQKQLKPNAT